MSDWDDVATGWDANKDVRAYADNAFNALGRRVIPLLPKPGICRVLDFGCGTGLLSRKVARLCSEVVAVDSSAKMVRELQQKNVAAGIDNIVSLHADIDAGSIEQSAELKAGFDLIVASSVCSFLPDYENTLCDLASILRTGGYFVQWDWLAEMPAGRIQHAFENSQLATIVIEESFAMQSEVEFMPVIMGIAQAR